MPLRAIFTTNPSGKILSIEAHSNVRGTEQHISSNIDRPMKVNVYSGDKMPGGFGARRWTIRESRHVPGTTILKYMPTLPRCYTSGNELVRMRQEDPFALDTSLC